MNSENYELEIHPQAKQEWRKLPPNIKQKFIKKLEERLITPRVIASKLSNMKDCYKIKLASEGYRLVYQVHDDRLVITVIATGKRNRSEVYESAKRRF